MQLPPPPAYTFELAGRRALLVLRDVPASPGVRIVQADLQVPDVRADLELTAGARFVNRRLALVNLQLDLEFAHRTETRLSALPEGGLHVRHWCRTEAGPACVETRWVATQRVPLRGGVWEWVAVGLRTWGPLRVPAWQVARDALAAILEPLNGTTPVITRRVTVRGATLVQLPTAALDGVLLASGRKLAAPHPGRQAVRFDVRDSALGLRFEPTARSPFDADMQSALRAADALAESDARLVEGDVAGARARLEALATTSPFAAARLADLLLSEGTPDDMDRVAELARSGVLERAEALRVMARRDRIRGVPEAVADDPDAPRHGDDPGEAIAAVVAAFAPDRSPHDALTLAQRGALALPDDPFAQECWAEIALRATATDQRIAALVARAALHPEPGPELWLEVAAAEALGGAPSRADEALSIAIDVGASGVALCETRAVIALAHGDAVAALEHLELAAAGATGAERARLLVRAGRIWLAPLERPLDAARLAEQATTAAAGNVPALLLHAEALRAAQLPDQAVALLLAARSERAAASVPAIDAALADAYEAAGDHEHARALRGEVARGAPANTDGAVSARLARLAAAAERQTTAQGRGRALAELGMATWNDARDPQAALDALMRAIEADDAQGERHEVLAVMEAAARAARDTHALVRATDLRLRIATSPAERASWLVLRADARRTIAPMLARADLEVAITLLDDPLPARRRLASLLAETGDTNAAVQLLDDAIAAAAPQGWERGELLADRLALPGEPPLPLLAEFAALRPGDAAVQRRLRAALWAAGRHADALEALRRALVVQLGTAPQLSLPQLAATDRSGLPASDAEAALELLLDALDGWRGDAATQLLADSVCSALSDNFGDDPAVLERALDRADAAHRHAQVAALCDTLAELVLGDDEAVALRARAEAARRAQSLAAAAPRPAITPTAVAADAADRRGEHDVTPVESALGAVDACLMGGDADAALDLIGIWLPRVNEPRFRRRLLLRRAHALLVLGRVRDAGMPLRGALILDEDAADTAVEMAIAASLRGDADAATMLAARAEDAVEAGAAMDARALQRLAELRALRGR